MAQPPYRYTGIAIPGEYGGAPRNILDTCIIAEELSATSESAISVALIEGASLAVTALVVAGGEEQKRRCLPPIARGEGMSCFALTEPGAGSDAAAIQTRAELKDNKYVINGRKRYASFASIANFLVVFAKTDPDKGARGISAFVVDKGTPGFSVVEKIPCLGMKGHRDEEVTFDNCQIPEENLIGEKGEGLRYGLATLDNTRTTLCAGYIGLARAAIESAVKYAKSRHTFGQPIANYQAISFPLTDASIALDAARLLTYRAAWLADKGQRHTVETAMAKAFTSEVLLKATNLAIDTYGGFGCTKRFTL
jgi:alkylation response protein AidB-like acyl-CoA dehydrogenase